MSTATKRTTAVWAGILACFVLAALVAGLVFGQRPAEAQEASGTLTGEELIGDPLTFNFSNVNCNPDGTSTFTASFTGVASGPYPGTFEETVTVTIGPQNQTFNNFDPLPVQEGIVQSATANFTIYSGDTVINGTKKLITDPNDPFYFEGLGVCETFDPPVFIEGQGELVDVFSVMAPMRYQATINSPTGTSTDQGFSDISWLASHVQEDGQTRLGLAGIGGEGFYSMPPPEPFPVFREECQKGGYQNFPTFMNQGDCIAFVETAGENEPGQNVPTSQQ